MHPTGRRYDRATLIVNEVCCSALEREFKSIRWVRNCVDEAYDGFQEMERL